MTSVLRSILLWLLLLAIPFQGVATAGMLLCGSAPLAAPAPAMEAGHDHAAMMAAAGHGASHDEGGHGAPCDDQCGTPGACCVGAALAPAIAAGLPALESASQAIPFYPAPLQAVDLAHPLRPPQAIPA